MPTKHCLQGDTGKTTLSVAHEVKRQGHDVIAGDLKHSCGRLGMLCSRAATGSSALKHISYFM